MFTDMFCLTSKQGEQMTSLVRTVMSQTHPETRHFASGILCMLGMCAMQNIPGLASQSPSDALQRIGSTMTEFLDLTSPTHVEVDWVSRPRAFSSFSFNFSTNENYQYLVDASILPLDFKLVGAPSWHTTVATAALLYKSFYREIFN